MKRLDPALLRLVALVALAGCGTRRPTMLDAGGRAAAAARGGTRRQPTGGTGGMATGGTRRLDHGRQRRRGRHRRHAAAAATDATRASMRWPTYFPFKAGNRWTFEITRARGGPSTARSRSSCAWRRWAGTGPHADQDGVPRRDPQVRHVGKPMLEDATISWQPAKGTRSCVTARPAASAFSAMLENDAHQRLHRRRGGSLEPAPPARRRAAQRHGAGQRAELARDVHRVQERATTTRSSPPGRDDVDRADEHGHLDGHARPAR